MTTTAGPGSGPTVTRAPTPGMKPWTEPGDEVLIAWGSDAEHGLTSEEADRRLLEHGPNELVEKPTKPPWRMLLEQFANTMIVVLMVAAGVTLALGDVTDTVVIMAIVVLNAAIGFVQEFRAERAMAALAEMTAPTARVKRDGGARVIAAREVVTGDLLLLETGDIVPADARLLQAPNLRVNESALTGESVPVEKTGEPLSAELHDLLSDRTNMVMKGTSVVYGRGTAVVTSTGMDTVLGGIAGLLQAHQAPRTPLQRRLATLGQRLAGAALIVCAIVFIAGVLRGEPVSLMFLTAVSLAVAAIPEALPAVVTISLALGAQRMARHRALVRKLPAVETLGSVTVICTDKTGTLTQGRMQVEHVWLPHAEIDVSGSGYEPAGMLQLDGRPVDLDAVPGLRDILIAMGLNNDASLVPPPTADDVWSIVGDPTEGALLVLAAKAGLERRGLEHNHPRIAEVPFDSSRKRMVTLHETPQGDILVTAKGAPEAILAVSEQVVTRDDGTPLTDQERGRVLERAEAFAAAGYRVLALASRRLPSLPSHVADAETELTLLGLVAMADPLRPESVRAVAECREAGILPVMITGDHPATARAIAAKAGIDDGRRLATGADLSEDGFLAREVSAVAVFARTAPEQKLDIVEAWKARDDVVAMTGDGVNDAPALRRAEIGIAMGVTGTEVAKEAADMVLSDDNFATIVEAVAEGRRIYDNIRRFVRYMLTANSGEIWVMLIGPFLGLPLPLLPLQILWVNLATDGLPALGLGMEPAERDVMRRPPRPSRESIFAHGVWQHVLLVGLLMGAIPLALGVWGEATGRPWQTMVFTSLACLQLGHTMAVRSETESLFAQGLRSNPFLLAAVAITLVVQISVVYWPPAQDILDTTALALSDLVIVLVASTGVFWAVELEKLVRRRRRRRGSVR